MWASPIMWAWTVCVLCLSFISYCLFAFVGTEPCLSLFVYSSLLCLSFSLTVIPLPLHFPICLFPCLSLYRTPMRTRTHTHAHTHTSVSLDIFPLFHPTLLYLHALSLSKVTASVFMSYPLCVGVCVCVCGSVWHAVTHTNTDAHIHLSMPSGPCAQLSVSLIPFPSSFLNLPSLPHSCSSSSFSLSSHQFLIFSDSRPPYRSSFFLFIFFLVSPFFSL